MDEVSRINQPLSRKKAPNTPLFTSIMVLLVGFIALALVAGVLGLFFNDSDPLHLFTPNIEDFSFNENFEQVSGNGSSHWSIRYEKKTASTFKGTIRHNSVIHLKEIPLLTHDVLVTSGEFADPELVTTSVIDHKFSWFSKTKAYPQGSINLLHVVPKNNEIARQIAGLKNGDQVIISGWEILRIDALDTDGKLILYWQDAGCNTLLVDSVVVEP